MARKINGSVFLTLKEYIAAGHALPAVMVEKLPTVAGVPASSFADVFTQRYGRHFLGTPDLDEFADLLEYHAAAEIPTLATRLRNLETIESGFIEDKDTETTDTLRSPNGTLAVSGYSAGGIKRTREGGASGDTDRLIRYQNERAEIITKSLDRFDGLFLRIYNDFGKEVDAQ